MKKEFNKTSHAEKFLFSISAAFKRLGSRITTFRDDSMSKGKTARAGFTLIELLVVVLIIGILSAVALPQYQKAVEKARLSEALINAKSIVEAGKIFHLANPGEWGYCFDDLDVSISGGRLDSGNCGYYYTKHFLYRLEDGDFVDIYRINNPSQPADQGSNKVLYSLFLGIDEGYTNTCSVHNNSKEGEAICSSLTSQGFVKR